MLRFTRRVFVDLAIWMMGLGLLVGLIFPFFALAMGLPGADVLAPVFFLACVAAGLAVGGVNIVLARRVIGRRLHTLADKMGAVESELREMARTGDMSRCTPEHCMVNVDSDDELGDVARAFNQLVEALSHSHRAQDAVRSFVEVLASRLELDALADRAMRELLLHTGSAAGAIILTADGEHRLIASHGIREAARLEASAHVRLALKTGESQLVSVPDDVAVEGVLTEFRPREVLVAPVTYKSVPLAAIVLAGALPYPGGMRAQLDLFLRGLALALNNALSHDRLQRLAALDALTGVYNRRFGLGRLQEEFSRAVRAQTPIGVLMFDVDHFKSINDTYGHVVGDRVLARVADRARGVLREGDVLMRYGGEEFLAVLPAASLDNAVTLAERLRRTIEETAVSEGEQSIRVTVSIGVGAFPGLDVSAPDELVARVDAALYRSKSSGRNRVTRA